MALEIFTNDARADWSTSLYETLTSKNPVQPVVCYRSTKYGRVNNYKSL